MTIVSQNDIIDLDAEAAADIEAVSVDLTSDTGAIGTLANPFDIDTSYSARAP